MNRVLIIEDEMATAEPVKEALELYQVSADIARNGKEGLALFSENNYDLILLDLKMPGMDGETVLTEIRKQDPFVDVIVYTNYSDFTDIKKLTNIGIQGYLNKGPAADLPVLIQTIVDKLAPLDSDAVEKMLLQTPGEMFEEK